MNEQEIALFFEQMQDVKPLKKERQPELKQSFAPTLAQLERQKAAQKETEHTHFLTTEFVEPLEPDDFLCFKKEGVQHGVFKNLRLGKYEIQATLDLQGQRLEKARASLIDFIQQCERLNIRTFLIRHGKGINSKPFPAFLKSYLNQWLRQFDQMLCFHSALPQHGGVGATYCLLKKTADKKLENREMHAKK